MKVSQEYIEAVIEANEILKLMKKEDVEKIPINLIQFFEKIGTNSNYVPNIKKDVPLNKQELKPKTKALLGLLYRQYLCDENQRKEFDEILLQNDIKYKQILQDMYSNDIEDIFKQRKANL